MVFEAVVGSKGKYELPISETDLVSLVQAEAPISDDIALRIGQRVMQETLIKLTVEALL